MVNKEKILNVSGWTALSKDLSVCRSQSDQQRAAEAKH